MSCRAAVLGNFRIATARKGLGIKIASDSPFNGKRVAGDIVTGKGANGRLAIPRAAAP